MKHARKKNHRRVFVLLACLAVFSAFVIQGATASLGSSQAQTKEKDFDAAMSYGESIGDAFAGAWTDANGSIHVLFTKDSASHGATLRGLVKDPSALQIGTARYSEQYLLEVRDAITRDEPALKQQGIEVYAVGPQPDGNKVVVRVAHADAATVALLQQRYGEDLVTVMESAPFKPMVYRDFAPAPWLGGIWEVGENTDGVNAYWCTSGFVFKTLGTTPTKYYLVTAGHCYSAGLTVDSGPYAQAGPIGPVLINKWGNFSYCDAEAIFFGVASSLRTNRIITSEPTERQVVSASPYQDINRSIYKSGITSNETHFTTAWIHQNVTYSAEGVTLFDQVIAVGSAGGIQAGDSGGPVYTYWGDGNVQAEGIISGGTYSGDQMVYSHIRDVSDCLGLYVETVP